MKHFILPALVVILGVVVALLHKLALENSLYWVYWWFDILMHFLGGLLVSLFGLYLYNQFWKKAFVDDKKHLVLLHVFLFTLIVGLVWESFELVYELTLDDRMLYIEDTIIDFIMNTTGVFVGYFFVKSLLFKYE